MYNKFVTTDEQHQRARAKHFERRLEEMWNHTSAADPEWLRRYMEEHGPYLYHGTPTKSVQESIMQHGLFPHDHDVPDNSFNSTQPAIDEWGYEVEPSRSRWGGKYLEPRADHVYLGTPTKAAGYVEPGGGMVAIDLRKLDPSKMNADEDAFLINNPHPEAQKFYDETSDAYDPPVSGYDWHHGMETLGQWADRLQLGNHNPEETHHSLANHGSIAYNGVIPPEAILPGNSYWEPQQPQQVAARTARADNSLHIGIPIPRNAASHIHRWAQEQQWPEGTELEPQNEYHMTLLFVPGEGHEHKDSWWVQHIEQARLKISGFEVFPSKERGGLNAYVLRVESPEAEDHARKLIDSAQWVGLEPSHPEQFKGHITVAYGPDARVKVQAPTFEFDAGPSEVSPRRYDKAAATNSIYGQPYESSVYSGEVQVLDHLSLASVAHNLHYKFEQGQLDPQGAVEYAEQLLGLIGYPADKMTTQAAIQAWQQLYPQDRMLTAPDVQPQLQNRNFQGDPAVLSKTAEQRGSKSLAQKNLPSSQANYHKDSVTYPSWWDQEPEIDPAMQTSNPAYRPTEQAVIQPKPMLQEPSWSAQAAHQHTGQVPGDEFFTQNPVRVQKENPNRGVNPSYMGAVGDTAAYTPVYIKPEGRFHANDLAKERAAFVIGHHLGVPVPHTVVMPVETEPGANGHLMSQVQRAIPGEAAIKQYGSARSLSNAFPEDARKIALLDNVIYNEDRHNGNMVIGDDGHLYPIDHGGAFDTDPYYHDYMSQQFRDEYLRPDEIEALKRARNLDLGDMGLNGSATEAMKRRIDNMLIRGKMDASELSPEEDPTWL